MNSEGHIVETHSREEEVFAEIMAIASELGAWGHNDSEIPRLQELAVRVRNGGISPEQGLAEARSIRETKQDYH
jgi:hypothetical protein